MRRGFALPYLTADLPGTSGRLKDSPEDFMVDERLLYEPSGQGEHIYIRIEKRALSTFEAVRRIGRALGVSPRDIGYAGMKDTAAVARQTLSVAGVTESAARALSLDGITILDAKRHGNKLRLGHLKGNRFRATIRAAAPEALDRACAILRVLESRGVLNFFGPQRFGTRHRNVAVGAAILRRRFRRAVHALFAPVPEEEGTAVGHARQCAWAGDYDHGLALFPGSFLPERNAVMALRKAKLLVKSAAASEDEFAGVLKRIPESYLEFYISALQAHLFNEVLTRRFDTFDSVLDGDLAWIHSKGAVFSVESASAEAARAAAFEISPSGPIFGAKMLSPRGVPGNTEADILAHAHLTAESFRSCLGVTSKGVRRPLRAPLMETSVEPAVDAADAIVVSFFLPKGSFATVVLAEITKPVGPGSAEDVFIE